MMEFSIEIRNSNDSSDIYFFNNPQVFSNNQSNNPERRTELLGYRKGRHFFDQPPRFSG